MSDELFHRVIELESRLVMQERTIEQLNEVILEQSKQFEQLRGRLDQLSEQLRKNSEPEHPDPPPPHY